MKKKDIFKVGKQVSKLGMDDGKFKRLPTRLHSILMLDLIKNIFNLL